MRLSGDIELYKELFRHIYRMHIDVDYRREIYLHHVVLCGKKRKQYPACTVGAECNGVSKIGNSHISSSESHFHQMVFDALLNNFGHLNVIENHSGNHVGHCAENYAASGVLQELDRCQNLPCGLSDICFTDAFQPRTWKMMDWCHICHTIFD